MLDHTFAIKILGFWSHESQGEITPVLNYLYIFYVYACFKSYIKVMLSLIAFYSSGPQILYDTAVLFVYTQEIFILPTTVLLSWNEYLMLLIVISQV